jgi:hypothetical protein
MDGDLTIEQIVKLSGESERTIKKDLKCGKLVNLSPDSVGMWLKSRFECTIEKQYKHRSSVFRKWD